MFSRCSVGLRALGTSRVRPPPTVPIPSDRSFLAQRLNESERRNKGMDSEGPPGGLEHKLNSWLRGGSESDIQQPRVPVEIQLEYMIGRLKSSAMTRQEVLDLLHQALGSSRATVASSPTHVVVDNIAIAGTQATRTGMASRLGFFVALLCGSYIAFAVSKGGHGGPLDELMNNNFEEWHPPNAKHLPGKGRTEKHNSKAPVFWSDVIGNEDAKEELRDLVDFLRDPQKYQTRGLDIAKGVLLVGPPGTGKTLLARALATEANVPFISANGSSFEQMFVGLGSSRVRSMFSRARKLAPCIVFIDELDSIGLKRDTPHSYGQQTLNQLLGEMDGFDPSSGVIVIGATNMLERLDGALIRPGRFDRTVQVMPPEKEARLAILKLYLNKIDPARKVNLDNIAKHTAGLTGADLKNLANRAGIAALKEGNPLTEKHLAEALDTLAMGRASHDTRMSELTKLTVAYHEGGHALVGMYTKGADPVFKATILPRGGALGFVRSTPKEEHLKSKRAFLAQMDVCMAGRAAEELIFGSDEVTQGAANDFQQATRIATAMVTKYGMCDKIGKVFHTDNDLTHLSPAEMALINAQVKQLLDESYERVKTLLKAHRTEHDLLVKALLDRETLSLDEIKQVIRFKE